MHGVYFTYNNESSRDYNLIIAGFDEQDIPLAMNREIYSGTLNQYRNKARHMGTNWAGVLSFTVSFLKDPCLGSDLTFTEDEISAINAWLTSPNYPILFHMYDYVTDENEVMEVVGHKYDYFGLFNDVSPTVVAGDIVGLTATFQTDSPFAWTEEIVQEFEISSEGTCSFTVNNDDRLRMIYPVITVTPTTSPGNGRTAITIVNTRDGLPMSISIPVEPVTIDCEKSIISDAAGVLTFEHLGIGAEDYIYWPRLYHGLNTFNVTGNCTVAFKYREPRKVGAY